MQSLQWFDYVILLIIGLSLITGVIRGFFKELISLGVWILAGFLSFFYAKPFALWLGAYIHDKSIQVAAAYGLIIIGTLLAGGLLSSLLSMIMQRTGLNGTDRVLGLGFGAVRGLFIAALFMVVLRLTGMPDQDYQNESILYKNFTPLVNWIYLYVPDMIKHIDEIDRHHTARD